MKTVLVLVLVCTLAFPEMLEERRMLRSSKQSIIRPKVNDVILNGLDDLDNLDEDEIEKIRTEMELEDSELDIIQDAEEPQDEEDVEYHIKYWRSDAYHQQDRYDKLDQLWDQLVPDEDVTDVEPSDFNWSEFPRFFTHRAQGSFCQGSDGLRKQRKKTIHRQGVVAKVEWIPVDNDQEYTGIYEEGSDTVILRLSQASNLSSETTGLTPSIALKFLVDKVTSKNILAMHSMKANEGSWNFFENQMQNRVPPLSPIEDFCEVETFEKKLLEGSRCPYATAVGHIGDRGNDGVLLKPLKKPKIPYELQFESRFKDDLDDPAIADLPWYRQLQAAIPRNSTILDVYALTAPPDVQESRRVKIAEVQTLTELYTSTWGDERLYFQHRRIMKDFRYYPKRWKQEGMDAEDCFKRNSSLHWGREVPPGVWPGSDDKAQEFFEEQIRDYGCPFAWLLD